MQEDDDQKQTALCACSDDAEETRKSIEGLTMKDIIKITLYTKLPGLPRKFQHTYDVQITMQHYCVPKPCNNKSADYSVSVMTWIMQQLQCGAGVIASQEVPK